MKIVFLLLVQLGFCWIFAGIIALFIAITRFKIITNCEFRINTSVRVFLFECMVIVISGPVALWLIWPDESHNCLFEEIANKIRKTRSLLVQ